jgi:ABC-type sugar transport system permease subunit
MVPALALIVIFKLVPLVRAAFTSLTAPVDILESKFVGIHNFVRMLSDPVWLVAIGNAAKAVVVLPIFVLFPFLVAALLFMQPRGWKVFRAIFFLSWLLPPVMVGYMFVPFLSSEGPLQGALTNIGFSNLSLLGNTDTAIWVLFGVVLWSMFGLGVAVYLSGLATISQDIIDMARVEGAEGFTLLRHILLPLSRATMGNWAFIASTGLFLGMFGFIFSLTAGGPANATMLPEYYIYYETRGAFDAGYASALGLVLFAIVALIVIPQVRLLYSRAVEA